MSLSSILSLPQKDRLPAYLGLLPKAFKTPIPGLVEIVDHLLHDPAASVVVGRQVYAEIVAALSDGRVGDEEGQGKRDALEGILDKITGRGGNEANYEEQVSQQRHGEMVEVGKELTELTVGPPSTLARSIRRPNSESSWPRSSKQTRTGWKLPKCSSASHSTLQTGPSARRSPHSPASSELPPVTDPASRRPPFAAHSKFTDMDKLKHLIHIVRLLLEVSRSAASKTARACGTDVPVLVLPRLTGPRRRPGSDVLQPGVGIHPRL